MAEAPKVSLIVTSHNQLKYSKLMYASLRKHTHHPYELVWVDCISTDGTREWLNSKEHMETVKVFVPRMGIGEAMNIGFSKCNPESKYIGDLDNDIILTDGWLTKLVSHLEKDEKISACSALWTSPKVLEKRNGFTPQNLEQKIQNFAHQVADKQKGIAERTWVNGCHTLYRRRALEAVGLWNPAFWICEDKDIGVRLTRAGWKCAVALDTWVYHFLSRTTSETVKTDPRWNKHLIESTLLMEKMYG